MAATAGPSSYPAGSSHTQHAQQQQKPYASQHQQQYGAPASYPAHQFPIYSPPNYQHRPQQQEPQQQQHFAAKPHTFDAAVQPSRRQPKQQVAHGGGLQGQALGTDVESQAALAFAQTAVRNGFVRKVFGILALQLLVTIALTCFCVFYSPVKVRSLRVCGVCVCVGGVKACWELLWASQS